MAYDRRKRDQISVEEFSNELDIMLSLGQINMYAYGYLHGLFAPDSGGCDMPMLLRMVPTDKLHQKGIDLITLGFIDARDRSKY